MVTSSKTVHNEPMYTLTKITTDEPEFKWFSKELKRVPDEFLFFLGDGLSMEESLVLSSFTGKYLSIPNIQTINEDTAIALAKWEGEELYLKGISSLDKDTAQALAKWEGTYLYLNRDMRRKIS